MAKTAQMTKKEVREALAEEKLSPNHRGRGLTAAEKHKNYSEYEKRKAIAYEAESRNDQHLVLFLASDGKDPSKDKKFYNMGGNSAMIYVYDIAPMIGRKNAVLRPDLDNTYYKFKHGMATVANLKNFTELLQRCGIERVKRKNDNDDIVYFKLKRQYTKEDIQELRRMHRNEVEEANTILYTGAVFPSTHKLLRDLRKNLFYKMVKMDRTNRERLWSMMFDPIDKISDLYTEAVHGDTDIREAGIKMRVEIDHLMDRLGFLMDIKLFEVSSVAKLGKNAAGLRKQVSAEMVNYTEKAKGDEKK